MKRYLLVALVLFAAMLAIWFMVDKWKEEREEQITSEEQRNVLGMDNVTGSAVSGGSTSSVPLGMESEDAMTDSSSDGDSSENSGAADESAEYTENDPEAVSAGSTTLEIKSIGYTEKILSSRADEVLAEATDVLKKQMSAEDLSLSLESVTSDLGSYIGIESSREEKKDNYTHVNVTLRYEGNAGATIRYVYDENGALSGLWFDNVRLSADPVKGSRYEEREIRIGRSPYVLDGILTLPIEASAGSGKPPVVLMISEHNDDDMDGTIGAASNKPLKDIAHGLALRGIASIRYNKRLSEYPGATDGAGIREYLIKDAGMAIDSASYLASVDTSAVYVLAWGEAAEYLPAIIEKRSRRVHGAILIGAKPARHVDLYYTDEAAKAEADAKYFIGENRTIPLLFLQGDRDFETTEKFFERWQSLLSGRANTSFHLYKTLGHYLFPGSKEPGIKDYDIKNNVNSGVVADIANWCADLSSKE